MTNPLKQWIEKKGITREEFATEVGLSTPFVIDLINGKNSNIKVANLKAIHEFTGIPYEVLVEWLSDQIDAA